MYFGSEREATEHVDPLFSGTGDLLTKDVEKAKALNGFVTSIYNGKSCVPGGIV